MGCSSTGIRKLEQVELKYYKGLAAELATNKVALAALRTDAATVDELAIREIARLDGELRAAKTVYSVREMLAPPAGAGAEFIQNTRNKVLLCYLMEATQLENQQTASKIAATKALQGKQGELEAQLLTCVGQTIESEKLLHAHLNKSSVDNLRDVFAEVQRQLDGFSAAAKEADPENTFVKSLDQNARVVSDALEKSDDGLGKFMELWTKLNKGGN